MGNSNELKNNLDQTTNMDEVRDEKKLTDDEVGKATGGVGMDDGEILSLSPELPSSGDYSNKIIDNGERLSAPSQGNIVQNASFVFRKTCKYPPNSNPRPDESLKKRNH